MEDDELTRARRALRGVDPELDLRQVYAESWARAQDAEAHDDWASDERVEIVLHGTGPDGRRTRRIPRRAPVLAWGVAAAAAAAVVVVVVSVAGLPPQGAAPGGAPPTSSVSAPSGPAPSDSPTADTGSTPAPLPSAGLTSAAVVDRAAHAVAIASCGVKTRSSLGDESTSRFYEPGATDTETPKPAPLDQQPLQLLHTVAAGAALHLADLEGTDYRLHDSLTLEGRDSPTPEKDSTTLARIRLTPPAGLVQDGDVTRMELLIDTTTWLPHSEQTWAESADGREYLVLSEFQWTTCDGASPSTIDTEP
ncbi:hypothetical protein [Promicromonospora panici]|uniref:hypothetical protein n=1 Tax=Promicromonospora panici TaxID=2219658 RepID=UPI00101DB580|nr:hypothetical protein [Promicromonospora panici]